MVSAVCEGESVKFNIVVPRSLGCCGADFAFKKIDEHEYEKNGMFWAGMHGNDHENWDITFIPRENGVYSYHFELHCNCGLRFVSKIQFGLGEICDCINDFQQTVYRKTELDGSSLEGGIIYQIFPDRFYFSGQKKENIPSDRVLRSDWGGVPHYLPDENGKILNNDYFGGDLRGIEEKLGYIKSLGTTHIYLNPIFEAHSNHRYNTADFTKIDSLLGSEQDFISLCESAKKLGISIILDGVFSHVGSDSVYFNKEKRYGDGGAFNDKDSPYRPWFRLRDDGSYDSWWGIETLPEICEENTEYIKFIKSVIKKWMSLGASGWRLDVADELPDKFIDEVYSAIKEADKNAPVILEVWEDASNKVSYGTRRRYLLGGQADSIMNYPFADAIRDFIRYGDGCRFIDRIMSIIENYPPHILNSLMTHLSTHDTARFITAVGAESLDGADRAAIAKQPPLKDESLEKAVFLMKAAAIVQFSLPGVPTIYYGDEAGLQGYRDPFNRACYPWGNENTELVDFYKNLGRVKHSLGMSSKEFQPIFFDYEAVCFAVCQDENAALCCVNLSNSERCINVPDSLILKEILIYAGEAADISCGIKLSPKSACIIAAVNRPIEQ